MATGGFGQATDPGAELAAAWAQRRVPDVAAFPAGSQPWALARIWQAQWGPQGVEPGQLELWAAQSEPGPLRDYLWRIGVATYLQRGDVAAADRLLQQTPPPPARLDPLGDLYLRLAVAQAWLGQHEPAAARRHLATFPLEDWERLLMQAEAEAALALPLQETSWEAAVIRWRREMGEQRVQARAIDRQLVTAWLETYARLCLTQGEAERAAMLAEVASYQPGLTPSRQEALHFLRLLAERESAEDMADRRLLQQYLDLFPASTERRRVEGWWARREQAIAPEAAQRVLERLLRESPDHPEAAQWQSWLEAPLPPAPSRSVEAPASADWRSWAVEFPAVTVTWREAPGRTARGSLLGFSPQGARVAQTLPAGEVVRYFPTPSQLKLDEAEIRALPPAARLALLSAAWALPSPPQGLDAPRLGLADLMDWLEPQDHAAALGLQLEALTRLAPTEDNLRSLWSRPGRWQAEEWPRLWSQFAKSHPTAALKPSLHRRWAQAFGPDAKTYAQRHELFANAF
ncbi:MAG: hypothetical protein Q7P63_05150 [Verrucomicrobiota bacterium JB022]|nr:hypothetical protein [Verrucomicrobiota bacterium JB022]